MKSNEYLLLLRCHQCFEKINKRIYSFNDSSFWIPSTNRWPFIWRRRIRHSNPEMLACFLPFPAHLLYNRVRQLDGSLKLWRAHVHAASTVHALIRINHYWRFSFFRIWHKNIHTAYFHTNIAPPAKFLIKNDWLIRRNLVWSYIHFFSFHTKVR